MHNLMEWPSTCAQKVLTEAQQIRMCSHAREVTLTQHVMQVLI